MKKRYDNPKPPYQRVLESPHVDKETKKRLRRQYDRLDSAQLRRDILNLQDRLHKRAVFKEENRREEARQEADDFDYIYL